MNKMRLDMLLVERNLVETSEKAKRFIMAGLVFSEQVRMDKPGMMLDINAPLTVKGKKIPYVGRGGLKLEKALKHFSISAQNKILIDVGSSTGGFTDCALQNGALLSYAIDVGYNQLDWKLRSDDRVIVMERTNFRYVTPSMINKGEPNLATIDVSFISLKLILPVLKLLLAAQSDVVALIKPQFEAERGQVENKGIVRDPKIHVDVLKRILTYAKNEHYDLYDITYSPITGGDGNIEFLVHFGWKKEGKGILFMDADLERIVADAHSALKSSVR